MSLPGRQSLASAALRLGLALAAAAPLPAQGPGRQQSRAFGFPEGLTNLAVLALAQGNDGMIYAGTESGLFRYNGNRFEHLELPSDRAFITSLLADPEEGLWIGTRRGLGLLEPAGSFLAVAALPERRIRSVAFDAEGTLWVLSEEGVYQRDRATRTFRALEAPPGVTRILAALAVPERPGVRLLDPRGLWTRDPDGTWRLDRLPPGSGDPLAAGLDGEGFAWVRTGSAMLRKGPGKAAWERMGGILAGPAPGNVQISRDREGWLWINGTSCLARCRGAEIQPLRAGPRGYVPSAVMVDQEGSPWLATLGVAQVLGRGLWTTWGVEEGLPGPVAWTTARDRQGRLWCATDGGLAVAGPDGWRTVRRGPFSRVRAHPDGSMVAVGSPGGVLYRVDPATLAVEEVKVPCMAPSRVSRGLGVGPDGTVWVSDYQQGLAEGRRQGGAWTWSPVTLDGKRVEDVFEVMQDSRGSVFLATRGGVWIREGGAWRSLGRTLPLTPVAAVKGPGDEVWVAYLDEPVLTRHRRGGGGWTCEAEARPFHNRPGLALFSLDVDPAGRLWTGTSQGLARLGPGAAGLDAWFAPGEGIPGADAATQGLAIEKDGTLWYGTSEGLGRFETGREKPLPAPRAPILLEWRAGGTTLPTFYPPEIPSGSALDARFATSSFCSPASLVLEARLPGVDSDWVPVDGLHVRYSAIPPGRRQLEVRLVHGGVPSGKVLVLPFRVVPRWWETWWARTGSFLAAAAALMAAVRARHRNLHARNQALATEVALRTRELRQANVELERASRAKSMFLASMSHELRTPLNAILLYSELLQEGALAREDAESSDDLRKIQAAGRHLLSMINNVLDLAKIEAGMMDCGREETCVPVLLSEVRDTLLPLAEAKGNRITAECHPGLDRVFTDMTKLRQVLINLGGNACKFTQGGAITLSARKEGAILVLQVADTGVGMDPADLGRIFEAFEQATPGTHRQTGTGLGLTISLRLVRLLGGDIEAWSEPGRGARFTVRIPLDDDHTPPAGAPA